MRDTGPSAGVRALVRDRFGGRCSRCRRRAGSQVHHRKPRHMGGTRDDAINAPANLVWLCEVCHGWIESRRTTAHADGWLCWQWEDPAAIPARQTDGTIVRFGDDGSRTDDRVRPW